MEYIYIYKVKANTENGMNQHCLEFSLFELRVVDFFQFRVFPVFNRASFRLIELANDLDSLTNTVLTWLVSLLRKATKFWPARTMLVWKENNKKTPRKQETVHVMVWSRPWLEPSFQCQDGHCAWQSWPLSELSLVSKVSLQRFTQSF